jgi:hypothetical protein
VCRVVMPVANAVSGGTGVAGGTTPIRGSTAEWGSRQETGHGTDKHPATQAACESGTPFVQDGGLLWSAFCHSSCCQTCTSS